MFHFVLFLLTFCIFHGAKADCTDLETDVVSNETSSNISYIYIYHANESENKSECNTSNKTSDEVITEEYYNENEEYTEDDEEFDTSEYEDITYSSTSSSELETQIEETTESSEVIATEECQSSQGDIDNDGDIKCTRPNEMYKADKKSCPLEICPSKFVIHYACNPKEVGKPGCVCKPGFLRISPNSTCIPKEQCPGQGNTSLNCSLPNERATCVKSCPPLRTCENRGKIYECPEMPLNASCTYQCACNDGYYRNSEGFCVTSELCDKKYTRPNEVCTSDKKTCHLDICPSSKFVIRYACNPKEVGQPGCVCKPDKKCTGPNEEYKADKKTCPPEICKSIISRYACDPKEVGQPGCVCKPGFLRLTLNSTCIPTNECPELANQPPECNLPHESLKCVKSCPRPRTCATRNLHYKCFSNVNETCKNECVCDDGFYRNSDGFCVSYDLCDKKCTGPNEEYKADKKTCPLEVCPSRISVIHYACNPHEVGQPGCACKPGFLRLNATSECIPKEQCPGQGNPTLNCSLPNESATCVKSCPPMRTCENRGKVYPCPLMPSNASCTYQCTCNDGYYRNSDGFCVTSELCDKLCPYPNEEYKADKKTCPPEICSSIVSRYACNPKEVGQPGCVCKSGFLRLSLNSSCIPLEECPELANQAPKCSLPNESLKCVKSCPRPRTCATRNIRYKCPDNVNETCKNECVCDDGYYRNSDGFCVTYDLCDKKCTGPNEEYKADKKTCPLEVCPSKISVIRYACNPNEVGQPGCACKPGFLRLNATSECIPKEQCPGQGNSTLKCSLPHESAICVKSCPPLRTCENRNKTYHCPNIALNASCTYQCACNDGYYRNSDGFCVTSELCDKKCPRPNEVYKADKKTCPLETCPSKFPIRYACNPREVGQPGCVCKPGFYRSGPNSTCIPKEQCPGQKKPLQCTLPNESLKCVKSCPRPRTCATRNLHYKCLNNVNETCKNECVCDDGFYRNPEGFCVTYDLCDKKCTGPNEVYKADKKTCPLEVCPSKISVIRYACNPHEVGQPGCACKPGFLRLNATSQCIPKEQCPGQGNSTLKCSHPHESAICVKSCPPLRTCENRNKTYHCPNIALNASCTYQCACNDGYYRNSDGFCVTSELCDKKCPRPNEVYKADKKTCPLETCPSKFLIRYACNPREVGQPGCVCKPGYYRSGPNLTCIPKEQCPGQKKPLQCTLPNESLKCVKSCPRPWTCATRSLRYKCLNNVNETCKNECVCNDGFYRNPEGFCVTYDLCDKKCTGLNEEYKADKKKCPPEICKSIVSRYACDPKEVGQPGCVCKPGFLRLTLNSTCIPTKECPELANQPPECNLPNESLKCVKSCPRPRTCASRNIRYKCPSNANETCKKECVCDDGYYRNSDGFCVTYDLCDKKCTGPNEEYKADKKTCPLEVCPSKISVIRYACNPNEVGQPGCACKPGFLRLNATSECIPKEQCPGQGNTTLKCSLPNESATCVKSCPPLRTCENRNKTYFCPYIALNASCTYKCACNDGYYRNSDGFCVTSELCDKKCPKPNEIYKPDKKSCPLEICPSSKFVILFACNPNEVGQPGCVCKPGYLRGGPNSTCIPKEQCPMQDKQQQCNLPNESLQCVKSCPEPWTCETRDLRYRCLNNENETCIYKCLCNEGYYRNSDGFCVTYDLCNEKCTDPNEVYKADKKSCPLELCPSKLAVIRYACNPNEIGQPGCACKPGFRRLDFNSKCIPLEECPGESKAPLNCTLPNESVKCLGSCPLPRTCENRGKFHSCPRMSPNATCTNKCVCNDGYYRNSHGFCVTSELCDKKCTRPNEVYKADKKTCPLELCPSKFVIRYACNPKEVGQPGCVCKPGFLRISPNSTCIPKEQCPSLDKPLQCTLPNESLKCLKSCPLPRTCATRNVHYECPNTVNETCKNECVCNDDKKCTGANEVYKADKKSCPLEICPSKFAIRYACNPHEVGQPGCACKPGYFRLNATSACIPKEQCPGQGNTTLNCSLPNESATCVKSCPPLRTCENRGKIYSCPAMRVNDTCTYKCACNDGFYRNSDGFCVTSELCDKNCTRPNEVYKADKKTCPLELCPSKFAIHYACNPKEVGQPGCVCKPGFLRISPNSTCIPKEQCPSQDKPPECTLPNESLKCVKSCPLPRSCLNRNIHYKCFDTKNETCQYKCICDDGFYRNSDGFCVTRDLCEKKCTGPNEVYKADKKKCPPETCQSILALYKCDSREKGQPGCVCKPGYLRLNVNSTCIPTSKCPQNTKIPDDCNLE